MQDTLMYTVLLQVGSIRSDAHPRVLELGRPGPLGLAPALWTMVSMVGPIGATLPLPRVIPSAEEAVIPPLLSAQNRLGPWVLGES